MLINYKLFGINISKPSPNCHKVFACATLILTKNLFNIRISVFL